MTDPIDTNPLRDAAQVLFKRGAIARGFGDKSDLEDADFDQETSRMLCATADELDRLRAVIENAPHREKCRPHIACTCWKADVS